MLGNPQRRYRIYLATGQQWRVWYGGERSVWAIGYTIGLNGVESGVVLRTSRIGSAGELTNTVQHELGHMVTLGGTDTGGKEIVDPINGREGIAEYISYWPRPATASGRRPRCAPSCTAPPVSPASSSVNWTTPPAAGPATPTTG